MSFFGGGLRRFSSVFSAPPLLILCAEAEDERRRYLISNCVDNRLNVIFSAILSCGIKRYFQGLPLYVFEWFVAFLHHLTAASVFAGRNHFVDSLSRITASFLSLSE